MPLKVGDKVIYTNNEAYDGNQHLLKRPSGIIKKIWVSYSHINMVGCNWDIYDDDFSCWNVPASYVKLFKESK